MPLSEHEERVLAELERAFTAEDPEFANSLREVPGVARPIGRYLRGGLGVLGGLGLLVLGVVLELVWVGVGGFLVMLAALAWALVPRPTGEGDPGVSMGPSARHNSLRDNKFLDRMEDRWDRRREGQR